MPQLDRKQRARLPDSAFAHVDSHGRRRLPIHDESHVRNALARFDQVVFEDEEARDRARTRLLKAAKRYGIVPIGFITGQLRSQPPRRRLPEGEVTFLLADIEDSTGLLRRLGDAYARLLTDVRSLLRLAIGEAGGVEVDVRADELFAVFPRPLDALTAALAIQRRVRDGAWPEGLELRVRVGLHTGTPTLTETGYVGLAVHAAARICFAAHGRQIVLSRTAREALGSSSPEIAFRELGHHLLAGIPEPELLFQVEVADLPHDFPPPRTR
jgi:class 3 adenylate cyclase